MHSKSNDHSSNNFQSLTLENSILSFTLTLTAAAFFICLCSDAVGQEAKQRNKHAANEKPTLSDFAWIAGRWQGEGMGGSFEESWSPPSAGSMMGMFKFIQNDEVVFYELLTIIKEDDNFLLRLKHFDKQLKGWEEKDKSIEFPLLRVTQETAEFDGIRFSKIDDGTMKIVVKIEQGGQTNEVEFVCNRVTQKN